MSNNIQIILTPLLIITYVSGLKMVEFSECRRKARFSLLYILLVWSIYFILLIRILTYVSHYNVDFFISLSLNIFISLMSVISGVYYNKKFKKCLQKIAFVDDTLKQLGITTDYQKLYIKIVWVTLGWCMSVILISFVDTVRLKYETGYNIVIVSSITLVIFYCLHLNFISDLIIATILGYIGLKFDQINDNLRELTKECEIKQAWKDHVLHSRQRRQSKVLSNKYMTWIIMHLHLELRKISQEINSIFGMQMTIKMGLYFGLIGSFLRVMFNTIFIKNFTNERKAFLVVALFWQTVFAFQVILINCTCERVTFKANAIGSFINRILSYSTCDDEIRENISQLLLQVIQLPLNFCGVGLFQFGFKFLYGFATSIVTVVIILVQAHTSKHC